jgi:hypothetical protein
MACMLDPIGKQEPPVHGFFEALRNPAVVRRETIVAYVSGDGLHAGSHRILVRSDRVRDHLHTHTVRARHETQ